MKLLLIATLIDIFKSRRFQIILKSARIFNHDETIDGDILIENGIIRLASRDFYNNMVI